MNMLKQIFRILIFLIMPVVLGPRNFMYFETNQVYFFKNK